MTKVEAVVIRERVETVIDAVEAETGHVGVTVVEAIGHGRQRGITHEYRGRIFESRFLPKALLVFVTPDVFAAGAIIWGGTDYAFFVEKDDASTLALLRERFGLESGMFSPYNVPLDKQYILLYYKSPMPYS